MFGPEDNIQGFESIDSPRDDKLNNSHDLSDKAQGYKVPPKEKIDFTREEEEGERGADTFIKAVKAPVVEDTEESKRSDLLKEIRREIESGDPAYIQRGREKAEKLEEEIKDARKKYDTNPISKPEETSNFPENETTRIDEPDVNKYVTKPLDKRKNSQ